MADIDIDKMLANKEEQEKGEKRKKALMRGLIIGGACLAAAVIIVIVLFAILGEKSGSYFPLKSGVKYIYNRKNRSPQEWQVQKKTDMVGDYECVVLNKIDQGNYSSIQEYYCEIKKGLARLAVSDDYGKKKDDKMLILPARMKQGVEFDAGSIRNVPIKAAVDSKETMSTPLGDIDAFKVRYRAQGYMDTDVWYGKDIGVIKMTDRITGDELSLISMGGK
jgi:hypothetical protein